ncbi:glycerate kinase [Campylobacter sp. MG1]|uniref:glycerate kinase n=1 Tax=Campylobacter sp. MG1 TaxID=2976332 RepID=UPI00226CC2F9|nr:glycerate kinase [Campylobacter sp. MG1]
MNILVICDSFKGSLSSKEANESISNSAKRLGFNVKSLEISDGGDGFLVAVNQKLNANKITLNLKNAANTENLEGYYLLDNNTAYFEMAEFAGIAKLKESDKNPLKTSTKSLGIAILDAINKNTNKFIIGIGGSATNDAGIGMLSAFGYNFLDEFDNILEPIGKNLIKIKKIDDKNIDLRLKKCTFHIANDVNNPLYGLNGAAFIYARQKGANDSDIIFLDEGLKNFANICEKHFGKDFSMCAGAGAAGGLAYGFLEFLNASFCSGFEFLKQLLNLEEYIKNADIVITGEGSFDNQSLMGKVIGSINNLCEIHQKKLIIFCGINKSDFKNCFSLKENYKQYNQTELMQKNIAQECLSNLSYKILKNIKNY